MRTLLFACLFLALPVLAFAGDLNIWNDWNPSPGDHYNHQLGNTFQKFENHRYQPGDNLKLRGNRLQVWEDFQPQNGDFYQRQSDGSYLRYKDWQPQFVDELKGW